MIRHLVALRFRADVPEVDKSVLFDDLAGLRKYLSGIADFQVRANISPEEKVVHGFRDLFWFDFEDPAARDAYLDDPEHKAVGARLVAALDGGTDGILVVDFEV